MRWILCLLVFAVGMSVRADEPKSPAKAAPKALTVAELGTMLENLGYELTPTKDDKGQINGYNTKYTSDGWTITPLFQISPSGRYIWITAVIARVEDVNSVPKEVLLAMLEESFNSGPVHIQLDSKNKNFSTAFAIPNANFMPIDMRTAITKFDESTRSASKAWVDANKAAAGKGKGEKREEPKPEK